MYRVEKWLMVIAFIIIQLYGYAQPNVNRQYTDSLQKRLAFITYDTERINVLLDLAESLQNIDSTQCLNYLLGAEVLARKINWSAGIFRLEIRLGYYYYAHNNIVKAIESYDSAANIALQRNRWSDLKNAYYNLAQTYLNKLGDYQRTLNYYNKILQIKQKDNERMSTWANIGEVYKNLGDYTKALESYEQALKIVSHLIVITKENTEYKITQSGLFITTADIYIATGEFDRALLNYQKALEVDNPIIKCIAYQGIGQTYLLKNDIEKSISNYDTALQVAYKMQGSGFLEVVLTNLANAYVAKGDITKAIDYALQAKATATKAQNRPQLGSIYGTLGKIYNAQKAYANAESYLKQALVIAQETGAKKEEKDAWEILSQTYTGMQQPAKAFNAYKKFIALRDTIYNADKAKELTRLDMQGEFDRKQTADSIKQADEKKIADFKLQRQRIMSYSGFAGVLIAIIVALLIYRNYSNSRKANAIITKANETIKEEKQVSENLLLNILPSHVADELKRKGDVEAKQFDNVTILFTDFVNFTITSERLSPSELVAELHTCFKAFDEIIGKYNIEKIKTVGDAYLAAAGLPDANPNHATDVVNAAIDIRNFMTARKQAMGDRTFAIRLGVNSGTVVAGIVGVKKFAYDIWGDAVNTAARMEQSSEHFKINISQSTYDIVQDKFECTYRGELEAKNKGKLKMYFAESKSV